MFHRQKTEANETTGQTTGQTTSAQAAAPRPQQQQPRGPQPERAPIKNTATPEKEKGMYQNQTAQSPQTDDTAETDTPANRPIDIPGNPSGLQRPMQPPRMPGTFPGSSYATGPSSGSYNPSVNKADGRRLVVGEGISLSGEIEACDILIVEGTIEAALKGAKILDIAESGVFYGTVEIEEATVAGRFEGELTVNGRLTIRSSGSITGTISYKELAVEAGAVLDGKLTPLSAGKVEKKPEGSRPQQAKKPAARNESSANELPFADKAVGA